MLNLDEVDATDFDHGLAPRIRTIRAFRAVAKELIDFMAQLEDFQKKLWLKKKFVVQCDWCMTMDMVPEELHDEVLSNVAQQEEWKKLGFGDVDLAQLSHFWGILCSKRHNKFFTTPRVFRRVSGDFRRGEVSRSRPARRPS